MAIASDLLQRHFQTLVEDNAQWQTLITDSIVSELPYAPAIGHPPRLSGRLEVVRHVTWFLKAVENFRFFDMNVQAMNDPEAAAAEVKAEGLIKARAAFITRIMWSSCVLSTERSLFCASILILHAPPRRWTRQFSDSIFRPAMAARAT